MVSKLMSAALEHPPAHMTVTEFLDRDSGDLSGTRWQLVDGELVATAPASVVHAMIQDESGYLLAAHLRACGSACAVAVAPGIIPRARENENLRIPDLGVTCSTRRKGHDLHDPVLLIEILSPSNKRATRANVWSYTTLPSVREILVMHGARIEAEVLRRDGDDWPANPEVSGPDGVLRLDSVGFQPPLREVYRTSGLT